MKKRDLYDWLFRFVKGMFIGSGFILPGVSGGALAAVFGIYERMIAFLANLTRDFKNNVIFFIPVGLGGVTGVFLLSFAISFFFETAETQIIWFFIGCIIGTMPALVKQAAKKGRKPVHILITGVMAVIAFFFLRYMESYVSSGSVPLHFGTWLLAGAIVGLGAIVPGLSPSNFLVYLDMYKPLTDGIKNLDFMVIIPVGVGAAVTVIALSKLMQFIFEKAYAGLFHFILGVVIASTIMIVPSGVLYSPAVASVCAIACALGIGLGVWMSQLEDKYKPD